VAVTTTLAVLLVGPLGLGGIALAIAVAAWLETALLVVILRWRIEALRLGGLVRVAVQAAIGTVIASALGFGTAAVIDQALGSNLSAIGLIVDVGVVSLVFGLAYAAVSVVLRIPELTSIVEVMVALIQRPRRS